MEIVISGKDKKRMKLIEEMAKELGLTITRTSNGSEEMSDKERSEALYQLMEEMANSGGIESIQDPVKWQREIRKDRPLYGRE